MRDLSSLHKMIITLNITFITTHQVEAEKQRQAARKRYPKRNIQVRNYAELEVPDEDRFIFCDDCQVEYFGDCPEHGPLTVINDTVTKR